jgi:hypothetical protein
VLFSVLDPLLAVVALSTGHTSELYWRLSKNCIPAFRHSHQHPLTRFTASSRNARSTWQREQLLQLHVLAFGLLQDGDVGVGVFPEG